MSATLQPVRQFAVTTTVFVALGESFPSTKDTLIFRATLKTTHSENGQRSDRLEVTEDIKGVHELLLSRQLVSEPDFDSREERYAFWREALSHVEVQWDNPVLTSGTRLQLIFRKEDEGVVELTDMKTPSRVGISLDRTWILEP